MSKQKVNKKGLPKYPELVEQVKLLATTLKAACNQLQWIKQMVPLCNCKTPTATKGAQGNDVCTACGLNVNFPLKRQVENAGGAQIIIPTPMLIKR